jgi:general stress protein 26
MSKASRTADHPEEQLWHELKHSRAGMLGIEGSKNHMQPMTPMLDHDNARLWFFTSRRSDLLREVGAGAHAHFCIIGKKQDYHACVMGNLVENKDRAKIDEYWNDAVGAWFNGKSDPDMTLLQFDLIDAAIWASTANPITFAWEIERSKNSAREPNLGVRAEVGFAGGKVVKESVDKKN